MAKKELKTNVMRVLDSKKLAYNHYTYDNSTVNGVEVARLLGQEPDRAARACGEKTVEMLPQKELLPRTGYVHGGCSPIGMKKQFPTYIHQTAADYDTIFFSAGRVGAQVELPLSALQQALPVTPADIIKG